MCYVMEKMCNKYLYRRFGEHTHIDRRAALSIWRNSCSNQWGQTVLGLVGLANNWLRCMLMTSTHLVYELWLRIVFFVVVHGWNSSSSMLREGNKKTTIYVRRYDGWAYTKARTLLRTAKPTKKKVYTWTEKKWKKRDERLPRTLLPGGHNSLLMGTHIIHTHTHTRRERKTHLYNDWSYN